MRPATPPAPITAELLGDQVERLVPARLDEHAVAADERVLQARALVRLQHGEPAALAQPAAVGRHVAGAGDLDDLAVLEVHHRLAAHAAVRAGGTDALQLPVPGDALGGALRQRPHGAGVDALAAELALVQVGQGVPVLAAGALGAPAGGVRHHAVHLDGRAGGPAAAAEDALGVVADDVGVLDEREVLDARQLARRLDLVLVGEPAELALAERLAGDAGVPARADDELERGAPGAADAFAHRLDVHALGGRRAAGRQQPAGAGHLDHAEAADVAVPRLGQVAQGRDGDAAGVRHVEDGLAGLEGEHPAVDGDLRCAGRRCVRHLRPPPRRCGSSADNARPRAGRPPRSPLLRPRRNTGCAPPGARPWDAASRCCR